MSNEPYSQRDREDLILRDYLAIDRTQLANERTFLAYVRTALALAVLGATILKFIHFDFSDLTGYLFMIAGAVVLLIGVWRFIQVRSRLARIVQDHAAPSTPGE